MDLLCAESPVVDVDVQRKDFLSASTDTNIIRHDCLLQRLLVTEARCVPASAAIVYKYVQKDIKLHMRKILTTWMMEVSVH